MTRVNINGACHQVEVQHDGADLAYIIEKAQKLWDETLPKSTEAGPAFGFSQERRGWQNSPMNLGGYGGEGIGEPRAGER